MSRVTNAGVQSVSSVRNSSSSLTEKYRRNGKLQSCEPCRKSKLRCDREFRPSIEYVSPLFRDIVRLRLDGLKVQDTTTY